VPALPVGGEWPSASTPGVAAAPRPGQLPEGTFLVAGQRRGVIEIGPATTVRADPLGLFERRVAYDAVTEVFVHPVTVPLAPLGTGLLRDLDGRVTKDLSMSDLAFHTLRDFVHGDDRRFIHWRSSAKRLAVRNQAASGGLMVRQFQDTRRTQLLVAVDAHPASYATDDEFEIAVSVGASIAVQAVIDELDLVFLVADQTVDRRGQRRPNRQMVMDACARAQLTRTALLDRLRRDGTGTHAVTHAMVVTGSTPTYEDLRRVSEAVALRHVATTVVQVSPGSKPNVRPGAQLSVLRLSKLGDLRALLHKGDQA
jgi:uncharacterized protein (DUF58 family)